MDYLPQKLELHRKLTGAGYAAYAKEYYQVGVSTLYNICKDKSPSIRKVVLQRLAQNIKSLQAQGSTATPELFLNYMRGIQYVGFNSEGHHLNWVAFTEGPAPWNCSGVWCRRKQDITGLKEYIDKPFDFNQFDRRLKWDYWEYGLSLDALSIPPFKDPSPRAIISAIGSLVTQKEDGWHRFCKNPHQRDAVHYGPNPANAEAYW